MKALRPLILVLVILTLLVPVIPVGRSVYASSPLRSQGETPAPLRADASGRVPDRLIVKFHVGVKPRSTIQGAPATGRASLDAVLEVYNLQASDLLFRAASLVNPSELGRIHVLYFRPGTDLDSLIQVLEIDPNVEWAEPDYLAFAAATTPNDPYFADQWGLTKIEAPAAWDETTGSATIPIAIVDSGVQLTHPDLSGKLWVNPGEVAGNGIDDDNNGYIDDVNGWDLVNGDNDPDDDNGHGTQVAGLAAASANNGAGIAGVCWGCTVMPVKVMQASGVANYSDIAAGVLYAAQKGAKVINLSLGGYSDSSALRSAVEAAAETYGAVVVAGAGNDNLSTPFYPAAYDKVLAVGGIGQADAKTALSNHGAWLDVTAPAEDMKTTFMGGDYGDVDGTSYAAPFAAGIAGLLRSQNPSWPANTVRAHIVHTADDIDSQNPGLEGKLGSGRLNADRSVSTSAQPLLSIRGYSVDGIAGGRPEPGSTVDLHVILTNDWADAGSVQATLSSSDPNVTIVAGSASFGDIPAYGSGTNATSFRFSVKGSAPYGHDMDLALHVTADGGYSADLPLTVQTASAVVEAEATITTRTWTNDRIYLINKETGIPAGETLTIEPGTEIRFDGNYSLNVAGALIAAGTVGEPILFTSNRATPAAGDWMQIKFLDSSVDATFDGSGSYAAGSILEHAIIEYGHGIRLESASPFLSHNTINKTIGGGIGGDGSAGLVVADNTITGGSFDTTFVGMELTVWAGGFSVKRNTISDAMGGISVFGSGTFSENSVQGISELGISTQGVVTVTANRVLDCGEGIFVDAGTVDGNLLAYNDSNGLRVQGGTPAVFSNTIVSNGKAGIYIEGGTPDTQHNNLIAVPGGYALRNATSNGITATNNWWGVTGSSAIEKVIYDDSDEFGIGAVDYSSYLTSPEPDAPAYVTDVNVAPDTTLGIQTATFDVEFSRPMLQTIDPLVDFYATKRQTWTLFNSSNSPLPNNVTVMDIEVDNNDVIWFANGYDGMARFDDSTWTVYNTSNSGIPGIRVMDIAIDHDGAKWICVDETGVARFDGATWIVYDTTNSGLPSNHVSYVAIDNQGVKWFGTSENGVARFDDTTWTVYNTSNSGLPDDRITAIAAASDGAMWFGAANQGVVRFDGTTWTMYNTSNSGLPYDLVGAIAEDSKGAMWFGTFSEGAARFDGTSWSTYNTSNSELPSDDVRAISFDSEGAIWFGTMSGMARLEGTTWTVYYVSNTGLPDDRTLAVAMDSQGTKWFGIADTGPAALWGGEVYIIVDEARWPDEQTYEAKYDITTLIPRGDYLVRVAGAAGTDGLDVAETVGYTITIDYAGAIGDTTPPEMPSVTACAGETMNALSGHWSASDADSRITLYSYAIGSTQGGSEVVNWTNTAEVSFDLTGLNLIAEQPYYVAVKARNEGGLWSEAGIPDAVYAGTGECTTNVRLMYIPVIMR